MSKIMRALKQAYGVKPTDVNAQYTIRTDYYKKYLYGIVRGLLRITCNADMWDIDYMRDAILLGGMIGCFEDAALGTVMYLPQLYSPNIFLKCGKARYVMQNYHGTVYERAIGVDTEIAYLRGQPTIYEGYIMSEFTSQIIDVYAQKLANVDGSIDVNLINSRTPAIFEVESAQQKASAEKMYDQISRGQPVVFTKKSSIDSRGVQITPVSAKDIFIADRLQDAKRTILNEFLTAWGINNANTDKRERLNADEVHSNDGELKANTSLIRQSLKLGCDKINAMFGVGLTIEFADYGGGVNDGADGNATIVGDIKRKDR